jgi:chromosomal replication initiation ATPase DnaA
LTNGSTESNSTLLTVRAFRLPDACPVCGFPPDEPGYVRREVGGDNALSKLSPCPECNEPKLADKAKLQTQLEGDLRKKTLSNYAVTDQNRAAYNAAVEFCREPRRWLTLWGEYGPGKTHLLAAIVNQLGGQAQYFTMPDLVSQYRHAVGQGTVEKFYEHVSRIPVLVIDEIDKADLKNWTREQTYRLFDYRYRNQGELGTVLAMNASPDEMDDDLGYLFSRMKDSTSRVIYVGGGDQRPQRDQMERIATIQNRAQSK